MFFLFFIGRIVDVDILDKDISIISTRAGLEIVGIEFLFVHLVFFFCLEGAASGFFVNLLVADILLNGKNFIFFHILFYFFLKFTRSISYHILLRTTRVGLELIKYLLLYALIAQLLHLEGDASGICFFENVSKCLLI